MKPIKPKKMPKYLEPWLRVVLSGEAKASDFTAVDARHVLAALEYERQRAEEMREILRSMFDEGSLDPYPTSDTSNEYRLRKLSGWKDVP